MTNDLDKAGDYQKIADHYYGMAIDLESNNASQEKINACCSMAAIKFWKALILGNEKAPLSLFKCFKQGVGVPQDDEIASLMYGVALKLTPTEAAKIPVDSQPIIPESLQPKINKLSALVQETHAKIPSKGVMMDAVLEQMGKFNDAIKLQSGNKIEDYLTEEGKKVILKSKVSAIRENIGNNKTIIPPINNKDNISKPSHQKCPSH